MICGWCDEPIDPNVPREQRGNMHDECAFGAVFSMRHIQRRCSCYEKPGEEHCDPPGLTKRQAALASLELARKLDALGVRWMNEPLCVRWMNEPL